MRDIIRYCKTMAELGVGRENKTLIESKDTGCGYVKVERKKICLAIGVILKNACEASQGIDMTASDRKVAIDSEYDSENQTVRITISDRGKGIDKEAMRSIFQRECSLRPIIEDEGTYNLYHCKRDIESMGGSISILSSDVRGTRMCVELPSATDEASTHDEASLIG